MSAIATAIQKHVILIVEDEPIIREVLLDHLSDAGFNVLTAANADDALEMVKTERKIELVFTDINMPGSIDGAQFSQWLITYAPDLPVILASGRAHCQDSSTQKRWFISKPYALAAVEARIRELLL